MDYSLFLDEEGNVYSSGKNQYHQLGLAINDKSFYQSDPALIQYFSVNNIIVTKISCGSYHSLALDVNGNIYSWGNNGDGRCGLGTGRKYRNTVYKPVLIESLVGFFIVDIKAKGDDNYAKSDEDKHWLWGSNHYRQCDLGIYPDEGRWTPCPYPRCIDEIFYEKTNCVIKDVYLGESVLYIIGKKP